MTHFRHLLIIALLFSFSMMSLILWKSLYSVPTLIPSPIINHTAPRIQLPIFLNEKKIFSEKDLLGHVTLINFWKTDCVSCIREHTFLMQLSQYKQIHLYGIVYKDSEPFIKKWLDQFGNPYQFISVDQSGSTAIDWGVYGTPETFILDKKGIIRYKQIGPITSEIWNNHLKYIVNQLINDNS